MPIADITNEDAPELPRHQRSLELKRRIKLRNSRMFLFCAAEMLEIREEKSLIVT